MKSVTYRFPIADQSQEPAPKILSVCQDPQRRAVAMNDYRPPLLQTVCQRVVAPTPDGHREIQIVRLRRTHNRHRKSSFRVGPHQSFFASYLVARIVPVRVVQRCRFRNEVVSGWFLINRGGADEDVLLNSTLEERQVTFNIIGCVGYPVDDDVKLQACQSCFNVFRLSRIGCQSAAPRGIHAPQPAIEQIKVKSFCYRLERFRHRAHPDFNDPR